MTSHIKDALWDYRIFDGLPIRKNDIFYGKIIKKYNFDSPRVRPTVVWDITSYLIKYYDHKKIKIDPIIKQQIERSNFLEKLVNYYENKITELTYQPYGPGMKRAQDHFESLEKNLKK